MEKLLRKSFLLVVVLASFIFFACENDDPKPNDKNGTIVGVWVSEANPLYDEHGEVMGDAVAYMWYQENGKFIEADCLRSSETGKEWIELSENGQWTVEKDVVTQTTNFDDDDSFDTNTFKFQIKGKSLFLTYNTEGEEITYELKKSTVDVIQNIINEKKKPNFVGISPKQKGREAKI